MKEYSAFGLNIESEILIPEMVEGGGGDTDVWIRYGDVEPPRFDNEWQHSETGRIEGGYKCYIRNIGGVRIEGGDTIVVCPLDNAEERGFRFLVSGIALGLLLHQRGFVTLHASAISVQDQAIGFVGEKGMGKSTTAAAFHAHGYPVVTDDLLVLNVVNGRVVAYPGFPHLKLNPDSIGSSLGKSPDLFPKVDPIQGTKRSFVARDGFVKEPIPLQSIYVLDYQDEEEQKADHSPSSEEIKGGEACIELVRNSYVPRLLPEEGVSRRHLEHCAEIARTVSVRRLLRSTSLNGIPALVSYVEQEVMGKDQNGRSESGITSSLQESQRHS